MIYPGFRSGQHARSNGREYKVAYDRKDDMLVVIDKSPENPDPARYEWVDYHRSWVAEFPVADFDRVFSVNTFARYRGHRCEVVSANDDGTMEVQYKDSDGSWAVAMGFVQHNKYEFLKTVPAGELHDYHERQRDLLFADWRERTFPRPPEATP